VRFTVNQDRHSPAPNQLARFRTRQLHPELVEPRLRRLERAPEIVVAEDAQVRAEMLDALAMWIEQAIR
jgi:hypothetical protein